MSVSFDQWRRAERRRFDAGVRALKRGAGRKVLRWSWRRLWPRRRATLVVVVLPALALTLGVEALSPRMVQFSEASEPVVASGASPPSVLGRSGSDAVTVIDGDTLRIGGERLRLYGIDAPESQQRCADGWSAGDAARRALTSLVSAETPQCKRATMDRYGRTVAVCYVNGQDIGAAMVRRGLAWAYTRYSTQYLPEERLARSAAVGVHARACVRPEEWRAQNRR